MSLEVLQNVQQIKVARDDLDRRGLSALPTGAERFMARLREWLRLEKPLMLGDYRKSWDLRQTIDFIESKLNRDEPILDIGAYASEVLVALHRDGFTDLTGVDLNPRIAEMPHADAIRFVSSDFMETPFADESFAAITSISVIEHGYDPERLMSEVARLLRRGGYFLASTDYWREKIDTGEDRFFGMSWLIFSEDDLRQLTNVAEHHGLELVGPWHPATADRAISHGGYDYTFAWLAFQKKG